jgi:hypothetical protein
MLFVYWNPKYLEERRNHYRDIKVNLILGDAYVLASPLAQRLHENLSGLESN